jgi:hypothetical protein
MTHSQTNDITSELALYLWGYVLLTILLHEFIMWQRMAFVITVVLLGFSGGVLALFVGAYTLDGAR